MIQQQVTHKVNLVDGTFTPEEAHEVVTSLLNKKINFHKVKQFANNERDINCDDAFDTERVVQLKKELTDFATVYADAISNGKEVRISGILNIEVLD